jgi:hypothetical protein
MRNAYSITAVTKNIDIFRTIRSYSYYNAFPRLHATFYKAACFSGIGLYYAQLKSWPMSCAIPPNSTEAFPINAGEKNCLNWHLPFKSAVRNPFGTNDPLHRLAKFYAFPPHNYLNLGKFKQHLM